MTKSYSGKYRIFFISRRKFHHSHGLIILKLQLARNLLVVLPCLGCALDRMVGDSHLPPRPGHPVNLHLHVADALTDPLGIALKRKNPSVIIIVDGNRGGMSGAQCCFGGDVGRHAHRAVAGGDGAWLQDGDLSSVNDARIAQAHVEVLVLFENIVINNADGELLCGLTGLEDQSALSKLIV